MSINKESSEYPLLADDKSTLTIGRKRKVPLCFTILLSIISLAVIALIVISPQSTPFWCKSITTRIDRFFSPHRLTEPMTETPTIPIMDTITPFTDFETMPLDLAILYYRSLKDSAIQVSSTLNQHELKHELGKALKRIFTLLNQPSSNPSSKQVSDQESIPSYKSFSTKEIIEMLGNPDQIETPSSKSQIIPGMAPGPYISNEFKPDQDEMVVNFIYYGESVKEGLKFTVSEIYSEDQVNTSTDQGPSSIVACTWFEPAHEE